MLLSVATPKTQNGLTKLPLTSQFRPCVALCTLLEKLMGHLKKLGMQSQTFWLASSFTVAFYLL